MENYVIKCWDLLSPLNWTGVLALSPLLELPPVGIFCEVSFIFGYALSLKIYHPVKHAMLHSYWADALNCFLQMYKLQRRVSRGVVPTLTASLEPLTRRQNISILSLSCSYCFGDVYLNWLDWLWFLCHYCQMIIRVSLSLGFFLLHLGLRMVYLQNAFL